MSFAHCATFQTSSVGQSSAQYDVLAADDWWSCGGRVDVVLVYVYSVDEVSIASCRRSVTSQLSAVQH